MTATVNDRPLVKADIHEPLYGVWYADVEVDSREAIEDDVITLDVEGIGFVGAVWNTRSALESGKWMARIAGGAAGMGTVVDAKNYVGTNVRGTLDDLMRDSGETLDVTNSDSTILAYVLTRWHRMQGAAGNALQAIMDEVSSSARMLRYGQLKVGTESFDELDIGDDPFPLLDEMPAQRIAVYAPRTPLVLPGVSIDDRNVEYVWTQVTGSSMRQTVWFADA